jgi:hypothetical protein
VHRPDAGAHQHRTNAEAGETRLLFPADHRQGDTARTALPRLSTELCRPGRSRPCKAARRPYPDAYRPDAAAHDDGAGAGPGSTVSGSVRAARMRPGNGQCERGEDRDDDGGHQRSGLYTPMYSVVGRLSRKIGRTTIQVEHQMLTRGKRSQGSQIWEIGEFL